VVGVVGAAVHGVAREALDVLVNGVEDVRREREEAVLRSKRNLYKDSILNKAVDLYFCSSLH
jgi:hypothetical protein